jgi:hypothetical protein
MNNFQQTSDGGYILCTDAVPEQDTVMHLGRGYLIKMNVQGQTQWIKTFPKTVTFEKSFDGNSVFQTADGGYIIGTTAYNNSYPNIYGGITSIYLIKTDVSGNFLWSKTYPGIGNSTCYCVKQTADLGFIVCGNTIDTILNKQYNYLMKTDNAGNPQWGKTFCEAASGNGGNSYCVNQTSDGGYVVTGTSYSGAFVLKTDGGGNTLWNNNLGTTGTDALYCVKQTYDGGYIATGDGFANPGIGLSLIKLDGAGALQWEKVYSYNLSTSSEDQGYSVEEVPGGYAVLDLIAYSYNALIKTDVSGNVQWAVGYFDSYVYSPSSLHKTSDGGYAFTSIYSNNISAVEIVKTDSLGRKNCSDTVITVTDSIRSPQINPPFVAGTINPSTTVNTVFTNAILNDSLLCPASKDVGIANFSNENSISIFPNPTSGNFSLQINSTIESSAEIKIYNSLGEMVLEKKEKNISGNFTENFSLGEMSDGIYFVSVKLDNKIISKKIILQD